MQTKQKSTFDLIKAFVTLLLGLIVLGGFVVALGGHFFWENLDTYKARFNTVKDLESGRPVKYDGVGVGRVVSVAVDKENPAYIVVEVGVEPGFPLYEGTVAQITQKGLVGDNYLLLTLDEQGGAQLSPGDELPTRITPSMADLAAVVGGAVEELRPKLHAVADGLQELFSEENAQLTRDVLFKAQVFLDEAYTLTTQLEDELQGVGQDAKRTMASARETFDTATGTLRRGDDVLRNVDENLGDVSKDISTQVNRVGDSVTALSEQLRTDLDVDQRKLERVLDEMYALVRDLRQLSRSLRERPYQLIYPPEERP